MTETIEHKANTELRKKYGLENGFSDGHILPGFLSMVYCLQNPDKHTNIGETTVKILEWKGKFVVVKYTRKTEDDFTMELWIDIKDNKGHGNLAFIKEGCFNRYIHEISENQLDFLLEMINGLEERNTVSEDLIVALG